MTLRDKHIAIALRGVVDERTKKLARALASAGADVCVHAFTFNREKQDNQSFRVEYHDSVEPKGSELSVRLLRIAHNLIIKGIQKKIRVLLNGEFGYKSISDVLVSDRPDLIIAINADTLAAAAGAAELLNINFIYESYEYWPDHAHDPVCSLSGKQRAFLVESERNYANKASRVITVSDYLAKEYSKDLRLFRMPEVIYNTPTNTAQSVTPVHIPMRVAFVGNIVPERNIEAIVDAVSCVVGSELFIQGGGYHKQKLMEYVEKKNCTEVVHFVDPVPYERLTASVNEYDVGVISYEVYNRHVDGALPNKFFEYMAGGLAMLLTRTHAFEEFENINDFARFIDPKDISTLTRQLEYLRDNPEVLTQMKVRALEEAQRYCGDSAIRHTLQIYEGIFEE